VESGPQVVEEGMKSLEYLKENQNVGSLGRNGERESVYHLTD